MTLTTPPTRTNADVAEIDKLSRIIRRHERASVKAQFTLNMAQIFLAQFVTCPEPRFAETAKTIADECDAAMKELRQKESNDGRDRCDKHPWEAV